MRVCLRWSVRFVVLIVSLCAVLVLGPARIQAQDKHVVTLDELNQDAARPAQTRQANEAAVRQIFSSEQAQNALKAANIDYAKVDKAVGQISDQDLAKLAERSRDAQTNFSAGKAGSLSDRDLLVILIIALLVILLVVAVR
jgi:preprotein translocase subunit SecF